MVSPAEQVRLVPRWYAAVVVVLLGIFTLVFALTGALADGGVMSRSILGLSIVTGLVLVSACSAFVRRRRPRDPVVTADGSRVFLSPAATVWPLVGALVVLYVVVAMWAFIAVTDFSELESPGFSLVAIVGALAGLPDIVRLLTGRLHRWRLELGPDALTYRGYRTDLTVPWAKVGRATIQAKSPAGVRVNVRGESKDPVIPFVAFDVPAEQLVEEIGRAKAAARR